MGSHCVHNYSTMKMLLKLHQIVKDMNSFPVLVRYHWDIRTDQLDALFLNVFISCLYMLRATSSHHQEDQIVLIYHLVYEMMY